MFFKVISIIKIVIIGRGGPAGGLFKDLEAWLSEECGSRCV